VTIRHYVKIDGQPVAKGRPRFFHGHAITPAKTRNWEAMAAAVIRQAIGERQYAVPLKLEVVAYFQRPQRLMRKSSPPGRVHHTAKPDCDNVLKIVGDALTMANAVKDDSYISIQICAKYYAAKGSPPHVAILLDEAGDA
jgi:Holliday junction resolvase RusA-like endonuclease